MKKKIYGVWKNNNKNSKHFFHKYGFEVYEKNIFEKANIF